MGSVADAPATRIGLTTAWPNIALQPTPSASLLLRLSGDKNKDVPIEESERMAAELEKHHVPHQFIVMKGYDHLFDVFPEGWPAERPPSELKDPTVIAAFDSVLQFLSEHVGTPD